MKVVIKGVGGEEKILSECSKIEVEKAKGME